MPSEAKYLLLSRYCDLFYKPPFLLDYFFQDLKCACGTRVPCHQNFIYLIFLFRLTLVLCVT